MTYPSEVSPTRIIILFADRFYANAVHRVVGRMFPRAVVSIAHRVNEASVSLATSSCDLLLTGIETVGGDIFDLLTWNADCGRPARRVFVMTSRHEPQVLATLRSLRVDGVFDLEAEEPQELQRAIRQVMRGEFYWSETATAKAWLPEGHAGSVLTRLTTTEQRVLAAIGDGCDDATAADGLEMTEGTVHGYRGDLYRKFAVHHKGDIMRIAVQLGMIIFTPTGVIRPGEAALLAASKERRRRREARNLQKAAGGQIPGSVHE